LLGTGLSREFWFPSCLESKVEGRYVLGRERELTLESASFCYASQLSPPLPLPPTSLSPLTSLSNPPLPLIYPFLWGLPYTRTHLSLLFSLLSWTSRFLGLLFLSLPSLSLRVCSLARSCSLRFSLYPFLSL